MSDVDDIMEVIERLSLYGRTGARTGLRDDILALVSHTIDREGDAWQRYACGGWSCYMVEGLGALPAKHAPYTIVYTPKEES